MNEPLDDLLRDVPWDFLVPDDHNRLPKPVIFRPTEENP